MSTYGITSFPSLWKPTEYRNIEAGKVSIGPIQAGLLSARWSEDELASLCNLWRSIPRLPADPSNKYADELYYLDPYSGGGSSTIPACRAGCNAGGSI
jgi:hypothetical protein